MLKGKVALVTGASRGIGRAIALKLSKNGATVIVNYNGSYEKAKETIEEIKNLGNIAFLKKANVANSYECKEMIADIVKEHGRIDILINNAGITKDNLIIRMTEEEFDDVIAVNLKGTYNCIKFASKYMMKQRNGNILNVSSVSGMMGNIGQINYAASKAGVIGITKSSAKELCTRNIRVNALAPGFIESEMTDLLSEEIVKEGIKQIPLGRFGLAEEVANAALFLVGEESSYITGQVLKIDGGLVM
ncbi:MAG TPA: 3-oxoacyl-[acyl-carrier-protein] reductase [Anaerovoracaceae bacterium]|nr:3-oxoacyl-[acyl-carrier-protein] reductase [Anaerovoracaceae bacterium]